MNCDAVQVVLTHSRSANAARMVLTALAARSNDKGLIINLPISELCKDANASDRTVKSAIAELRDELKELKTEREAKGRGHTFDFDISPLLEKVKNLHVSDKGAEVSPIEVKGEKLSPIPTDKGENNVEIGADTSPLPGVKGEDFTGTPIAPLSAETTNKKVSQPSVEAGRKRPRRAPHKTNSAMSKLSEAQREILESWRGLAKAYPPEYAWPTIFKRVLDGFDAARFKRCGGAYLTHNGRGQRHVGGILDWYEQDRIEPGAKHNAAANGNRNAKPTLTNRVDEYADYFGGESSEERTRQNHR